MLIILWVLIPIAFITTILFCWLVYAASIKKRKALVIKELEFLIKKERIIKIDSLLNRIYVISKANSKHEKLYNNLSIQHTQLGGLLKKLEDEFGLLVLNGKELKIRDFDLKAKSLRDETKLLNDLQHDFETAAENITQQDEFMKSEMTFYTNNLRKVIKIYKQKRFLLEYISLNLDTLLSEISQLSKEFEVSLDKANTVTTNIILNNYSRKVIKFSRIVNEAPSVQSYLYITIPNLVKKLTLDYNKKKREVGGALGHINFIKSISDIASKYKKAKINFSNLNFEKAEKRIKSIIKSIKILERLINFEIESRNTFVKNYLKIINLTKETFIAYINIKKRVKKLSNKNEIMEVNLIEKYDILKTESGRLDKQAVEFKEMSKLKTISFSEKLTKMKLLAQKNKMIMSLINELSLIIWNLDTKILATKNKFRKAENALQQISYTIKKDKIVVSNEEDKELESLSHDSSKISLSFINNNFSKEIKFRVDEITKRISNYYQAITTKIEIANIVKNMIKEFSSKRGIDAELNAELIFAESLYLKGSYTEALNIIINNLKEKR